MLPVLFHIGPYPIGTHDFFVLLGVIAATLVYLYEADRRTLLDDRLLAIGIGLDVEFVRGNQVVWEGLTRSQLFLIPSTMLLLLYFWRQLAHGAYAATALKGGT